MGAIAQVLDQVWPQRVAILRRHPRPPELSLYLDTETYLRCLADDEVFRYIGPARSDDGSIYMYGMRVYQVVSRAPHVRVAEVVEQ